MASVSQLKAELAALEKKLKTMKKRLQELKKINSGLEKNIDSQVVAVNQKIGLCSKKIESGLWGFQSAKSLPGDVEQKAEKSCMGDSYMQEMVHCIEKEIGRCEREKTSLESAIRQKKAEIEEAKRKERESRN